MVMNKGGKKQEESKEEDDEADVEAIF